MRRDQNDPYAPPPRHRDSSGAVVRFVIIAGLIGAAAWGYMEYANQPQTAVVAAPVEEQTFADSAYDAPPTAEPTAPAPAEATSPAGQQETAEPPA